jgi:hypothetical protein
MHVALCAHWVRGIISPAEAGAEGLVTWANSSYERTDLAGRLSIHTNIPTAETRIVLYGNEQRSRSFMVGSVLGLVDIDRSEVHPLPPQFRGGERDRLPGYFSSTGCGRWLHPGCLMAIDLFGKQDLDSPLLTRLKNLFAAWPAHTDRRTNLGDRYGREDAV